MGKNNLRPQSQCGGAIDVGDWRSQLKFDSRTRIANKVMETLKMHLPFQGQEGLLELKNIAVRFEERIFSTATSQMDYLRKISLKMLAMESQHQNPIPNNLNGNRSSASAINLEASKKRKRQNEGSALDHLARELAEYKERCNVLQAEREARMSERAAKEAVLRVVQRALKASQDELKAVKGTLAAKNKELVGVHAARQVEQDTLEILSTNVDLVEERHIKCREAIVEKWMQSEAGKASLAELNSFGYFKGFEHAYRAKAIFGEDYLLEKDQFGIIEALPHVDCFSQDLPLPKCIRPRPPSDGDGSQGIERVCDGPSLKDDVQQST